MKKKIALLIVAAMCFLLTACGSGEEPEAVPGPVVSAQPDGNAENETLEIDFAIPATLPSAEAESLKVWAALASERSAGSIVVRCAEESERTGNVLLEETASGVRNIALVTTEELCVSVPEAVLLQLPFVFDSHAHAAAVFGSETGEELRETLAGIGGVRVLNTFLGGFHYILSDMELASTEDCRGLLIRAPKTEVFTDMLGIMEFSYITMDWDEAYGAMSGGVITAVEGPLQDLIDQHFYALGGNILCTRHMLDMRHVVVNEAWWTALTDAQRAILRDALAEVAAEQWDEAWAAEKLAQSALEEEGVAFIELSKADKKDMQETFVEYRQSVLEAYDPAIYAYLREILGLA